VTGQDIDVTGRKEAPNAAAAPLSSSALMTRKNLADQFILQAEWTGDPGPVYKHLDGCLKFKTPEQVQAAVSKTVKGDKPWSLIDVINGVKPRAAPQSFAERDRAEIDANLKRAREITP
jgi:hypothetical protein